MTDLNVCLGLALDSNLIRYARIPMIKLSFHFYEKYTNKLNHSFIAHKYYGVSLQINYSSKAYCN